MRKATPPLFALASMFLWMACETEPPTRPVDLQPAFAIGDAANDPGFAGFYWLPPMVAQPNATGSFIGTLSPSVEICRTTGSPPDCVGPSIRIFTRTTGVDVDVNGKHYQVNWKTDEIGGDLTGSTEPITPGTYRITVMLSGSPLGFADITIMENGGGFKTLDDDVIGLMDGRTVPIKFRIEYSALASYDFNAVYHSNRDADLTECDYNTDVFLMNQVAGVANSLTNLTSSPNTLDGTPSWSPDGTKVVFASNRDQTQPCSEPDIYIMDLIQGGVDRLTTEGGWKPAWSPNGQWIAFQRGWPPESVAQNIFIVPAAGGTEVQLTDPGLSPSADPCEDIDPAWHPEGDKVTFARQANEGIGTGCPDNSPAGVPITNFALFSVDITDLSWIRHTGFNPAGYPDWVAPRWSPDGHLTAQVDLNPGADVGDLLAFAPRPVRLTDNPEGDDQNPSWAPDSEQVMFTSFRGGFWGIYHVDSWSAWKDVLMGGGPSYPQTLLVGGPGELNAWGRFRPGS